MNIEVLWSQAELEESRLGGRVAVAVDVVRATTTILAALEAGAERVVPVATLREARKAAREAENRPGLRPLLCGERDGRRIEGFDHGNSPRELAEAAVEGRTLIFTTTNGTPLLRRARAADLVLLACFRNLSAVVRRLVADDRDAVLACAGKDRRPALDDLLCAGHLVRILERRLGEEVELGAGARDALALAASVGEPDPTWLAETAAGRALVDVGLAADLDWCAEVDATLGVPVLEEGAIRLAGAGRPKGPPEIT